MYTDQKWSDGHIVLGAILRLVFIILAIAPFVAGGLFFWHETSIIGTSRFWMPSGLVTFIATIASLCWTVFWANAAVDF